MISQSSDLYEFPRKQLDEAHIEIKELTQYNASLTEKQNNKILRERERYWIKYYKSDNGGLNENSGGSGCGSHTIESKQKICSIS